MNKDNGRLVVPNEHKRYHGKTSRIKLPILAELEITSVCNANCIFCPRERIPSPHHMSSKTWTQVRKRLKESHIRTVKLAGFGEPTLHPYFLNMLEDLYQDQFEVRLNTNLSTMHKLDARYILSKCVEVIASIHSLDPSIYKRLVGRDYLKQVSSNLLRLISLNHSYSRKVTVYVVVTRLNPNAPEDFRPYLNDISLRLSGCSNRVVDIFPNAIIDFEANQRYNHYPVIDDDTPECGFASAACVIDCDGNYLLCTNDISRRSAESTVWSNSLEDALIDFQNKMKCGEMLHFCRRCENFNTLRENLRTLSHKNHEDT